jgi:type II secretory pathway pseudopilin PulG
MYQSPRKRKAFSLIRTIVGLAIILLAAALVFPALQHLREDGNRATCANNLRQLVLATHSFHATNGTLPPYWGAYPDQDSASIKGSWFCHLLPYVGETAFYGEVMADIAKTGVNWDNVPPSPDKPDSAAARLAGNKEADNRVLKEVARYNGHRHWEWVESGAVNKAPADAGPKNDRSDTAEKGPAHAPGGIFRPNFSGKEFSLLQCPSDPSPGSYLNAGRGQVYLEREQRWGSTNYLANWNAFANNNPQSGYLTPPQSFAMITDGLASTVLFSEGYAWCDGKGRLALNSWDYHSLGLTWSLNNAIVDDGSGEKRVDFPRGMPNTYLFQIRPRPRDTADCGDGSDCCNNWRAQTGHDYLNAAMADGSIREFSRGTTQRVWDHALLPRDGPLPGWDW